MSITPAVIHIADTVLPAADLNANISKIIENALQLISPLTGNLDFDGNSAILDDDGDTSINASTDDLIAFVLGGGTLIRFDGTVTSPVNGFRLRATATGTAPSIEVTGNPNRNLELLPSGTGRVTQKGVPFEYDSDIHRAAQAFG